MADSVIPGAEVFYFKDLELHGNLVSSSYTRRRRLAVHEYLKRDGGQVEDMGREPFRVSIVVTFVGDDFRDQLLRLARSLDDDSAGRFVDPLFGEFPAVCEGIDRALLEPDKAVNAISVPLSFIENNVDAKLSASRSKGASTAAQGVTEAEEAFQDAVAAVDTAGWVAAQATAAAAAAVSLSDAALAYSTEALNSALEGSVNTSLTTRLAEIGTYTEAVQAAYVAGAGSEVMVYDVIAASEVLASACVAMQQAILDARPPMGRYTVPTPTQIVALAQQFYGVDGLARIDEILSNNPDLGDAAWIPAGTVLVMAQPTV